MSSVLQKTGVFGCCSCMAYSFHDSAWTPSSLWTAPLLLYPAENLSLSKMLDLYPTILLCYIVTWHENLNISHIVLTLFGTGVVKYLALMTVFALLRWPPCPMENITPWSESARSTLLPRDRKSTCCLRRRSLKLCSVNSLSGIKDMWTAVF